MTDLISEGLAWLAEEQFAHLSRAITYRRDGQEIAIPAIIGKLRTELPEAEQTTVAITGRRFWLRPRDIDFGRGLEEPRRGDEIALPLPDGKKAIYQITGFPPGQQPNDYLIELSTTYARTE